MSITVHIRDNTTGETREHRDPYDWFEFLWSDGNYGCDCNRGLFFGRAGPDGEGLEVDCGEERFSIVKVIDADGRDITFEDSR